MPDETINNDLPDSKDQVDQKSEQTQEQAHDEEKKVSTQIPKRRFDEVNEKYKAANKELEEFRAAKKDTEHKKLEEEGKYQELLSAKDKELEGFKSSLETEKRGNKLEKLKNKSLSLLNKAGIVDGDDGLRFMNLEELIDNESPDEVLNNMVTSLKDSKSYLFTQPNKRNASENGMPGTQKSTGNTAKDAFSKAFLKGF